MAATLKTTVIQEPSSASANITLDSNGNGTFAGTAVMSSPYTMRNKIINGAMVIDQRNAGASVSASNIYTLDRWVPYVTPNNKFNVQQNANSVTPPTGFTNYLGCTSTSAYTLLSTDYQVIHQAIEGFNCADLAWGTINAKTVTLSFQVYSSLTGTFGGSLQNSAQTRSYPFTYTISSANTWASISITISGDTSGAWLTTNGVGVRVNFSLGSGTSVSGTAGAWAGANYWSATGATSVVGTNGATFYITGVQLERGTVATPFEYRNYQQELAMCKRYYDKTFPINTAPVTNYGRSGAVETYAVRTAGSAVSSYFRFSVPMRATPTMTFYNPQQTNNQARNLDLPGDCTSTGVDNVSEIGGKVLFTLPGGTGSTNLISVQFSADAEL